jgi:hypothetical protein
MDARFAWFKITVPLNQWTSPLKGGMAKYILRNLANFDTANIEAG